MGRSYRSAKPGVFDTKDPTGKTESCAVMRDMEMSSTASCSGLLVCFFLYEVSCQVSPPFQVQMPLPTAPGLLHTL